MNKELLNKLTSQVNRLKEENKRLLKDLSVSRNQLIAFTERFYELEEELKELNRKSDLEGKP